MQSRPEPTQHMSGPQVHHLGLNMRLGMAYISDVILPKRAASVKVASLWHMSCHSTPLPDTGNTCTYPPVADLTYQLLRF